MFDKLFIVVPCYFDEDVLPITAPLIYEKLKALIAGGQISAQSGLVMINDGSTDRTWQVIKRLQNDIPCLCGVDLVENVGEQNALLAGMTHAVSLGADCVITMDSDLQDDIGAVKPMIEKYLQGNDLVLGVRCSREQDPLSERFFSGSFYFLMRLLRTGLVKEHANYRLMSRKAIAALSERLGRRFYLPVEVCGIDLPRATVEHVRFPRAAGESGYNFRKKLGLAVKAIECHANVPPFGLVRRSARFSVPQPRYRIRELRK